MELGESLSVELTVATGYTLDAEDVQVTMGGVDVTALVYNSTTKTVAIGAVTSAVVIKATATHT